MNYVCFVFESICHNILTGTPTATVSEVSILTGTPTATMSEVFLYWPVLPQLQCLKFVYWPVLPQLQCLKFVYWPVLQQLKCLQFIYSPVLPQLQCLKVCMCSWHGWSCVRLSTGLSVPWIFVTFVQLLNVEDDTTSVLGNLACVSLQVTFLVYSPLSRVYQQNISVQITEHQSSAFFK
jgi:hypothetical protein